MKQKKGNLFLYAAILEIVVMFFVILSCALKDRTDIYYGDAYDEAVPTEGYEIELDRGSYMLELTYQTNADNVTCNTVMMTSYGTVTGEDIPLFWQQTTKKIEVRASEHTDSFCIRVNLPDDAQFHLSEVHLTETGQKDRAFCFTLAAIFLFIDLLLYLKQKKIWENLSREKKHACIGLIVITLIAMVPVCHNYLTRGHDFRFHLVRIAALAEGLAQGQFPVRMQPVYLNDYGFPISVIYGDLFLYIPALLKLAGFTLQAVYKIYLVIMTAVTVWISYYCAKNISGSYKTGLLGSFLYTMSFYRLLDVYIRNALGEYTAMAFMPLVFLSLYRIFHTEGKEKRKYALLLGVSLSAILQSHMLSFEMVIVFSVIYCLFCAKAFWKNLLFLVKTGIITILANLSFLVPFLDYMISQDVVLTDDSVLLMREHGIFPAQLFQTFSFGAYLSGSVDDGINADMPIGIGLALIGVLFLFAWQYFVYKKQLKEAVGETEWKEQCRLYILVLLSILMSCWFFPWNIIEDIPGAGEFLAAYQFPWRFLTITTVMGISLAVYVVKNMQDTIGAAAKNTVVLLLCVFTGLNTIGIYDRLLANYEPVHVTGAEIFDSVPATAGEKGMLKESNGNSTYDISVVVDEEIALSEYEKEGLTIRMALENTAEEDRGVIVPLYAYKEFIAKDIASGERLETFVQEEDKKLGIIIPANYSGEIKVAFHEPWFWRAAEIVNLLVLIALLWQMTGGFKRGGGSTVIKGAIKFKKKS